MNAPQALTSSGLKEKVFAERLGETIGHAELDDKLKFLIEALRLVETWKGNAATPISGSFCFVMSEEGLDNEAVLDEYSEDFKNLLSLKSANFSSVEDGRIYLCSLNLRTSRGPKKGPTTSGPVLKWLEDHKLESHPTVIVQVSEELVLWYPDGTSTEASQNFQVDTSAFADHSLDHFIEEFHKKFTMYPTGPAGTVWYSAKDWVVISRAEDHIRDWLWVYLDYIVYRSGSVLREVTETSGRSDLKIVRTHLNDDEGAIVVELKVLRSKAQPNKPGKTKFTEYSASKTKKWVEGGIQQADDYRQAGDVKQVYCCCFDARSDKKDLECEDLAKSKDVILNYYPMYNERKNSK